MADSTESGVVKTEEDQIRANVYGLLGALLTRPPDKEIIALLREIDVDEKQQASAMAASWKTLNLAAKRRRLNELNDEYHKLFIGVGRGEVVPYGSWYLTGFMMDRPLAQLRQDLINLGLERAEHVKEPEDHAGALCESMSLLLSIDDGITAYVQKRFFDHHIASWMTKFFEDLQTASSADFYKAVGSLGEQFIELEKQYLDMLPH
jgi:TorA maturation chaperone TorD